MVKALDWRFCSTSWHREVVGSIQLGSKTIFFLLSGFLFLNFFDWHWQSTWFSDSIHLDNVNSLWSGVKKVQKTIQKEKKKFKKSKSSPGRNWTPIIPLIFFCQHCRLALYHWAKHFDRCRRHRQSNRSRPEAHAMSPGALRACIDVDIIWEAQKVFATTFLVNRSKRWFVTEKNVFLISGFEP